MSRIAFGFVFLTFSSIALCQNANNANWKQMKHARTNALRSLQESRSSPHVGNSRLNYFGLLKTNEGHFKRTLSKILIERVPDSTGSKTVRDFIAGEMSSLGWSVQEDPFEEDTVIGKVKFTNIIATLNPNAPRRMVLVCHYDSKISPQGFLGATDSAVPCAQMINLAHTMKMDLDDQKNSNSELTLQLLFLDGEEAFVQWTATDSIYGARHLASKLETTNYEYNRIQGSELDRMDIFVLLDLLGAKDPNIISSQDNTDPWFRKLVEIEEGLTSINAIKGPRIFSTMPTRRLGIEDDHIPFLRRSVPILHLIPVPFPDAWHKIDDNASVVDYPTVEKLNKILRVFVSEYLELA